MNDFSDLVSTFTSEELSEHDKQIRADAIDDSIRVFTEIAEICGMGYTFIRRVGMKMEQLKKLK